MEISWSFLILIWTFQISQFLCAEIVLDLREEAISNTPTLSEVPNVLPDRGPMKKIPGTNFFSAILYRVAKTTPKGGLLTYVDDVVEGVHEVQVDTDPIRALRYQEGNDWFGKDKWMFLEAPDFPGWFELRHKFFADGYTAVSNRKIGGGFYIIVSGQNDTKFSVGGSNRDYALWKPVGVNGEYYQIKNKQIPQGIITNTTNGIGQNWFYIQIDIDPANAPSYEEGGCNFDQTLFSAISRPNFVLNAKIDQFVFIHIPKDLHTYRQTSIKNIDYDSATVNGNKTSYKIAQLFFDTHTLACIVDGKFQGFNQTTVKFEVPPIGDLPAHSEIERPLSADGTLTETETKETEVTMAVEVPTSRFVSFLVHSQWYDDVPVQFKATMKITGTLRDGTILSSDFIGSNLPVDWRNSQGSAASNNTWQIEVKGKLLLSFGHQREILVRLNPLAYLQLDNQYSISN